MKKYEIAVLDDYQNVAPESADWSVLRDRGDIAVFQDHLADPEAQICAATGRRIAQNNSIGTRCSILLHSQPPPLAPVSEMQVTVPALSITRDRDHRERRKCCEDNNFQNRSSSQIFCDAGSNTASMSANHRQAPGKVARDSDIRCLAPPPT